MLYTRPPSTQTAGLGVTETVLDDHDADPVVSPERDGVSTLTNEPTIVSISDIHGYLRDARNALLTLTDHPEYDPIVEPDPIRRLQWVGGDEYVLVFNGDLIDRGPHNEEVIEMVERLLEQAPPGHVRVTFGNHEMGVLTPDRFGWKHWYSAQQSDAERQAFARQILDGHVVAAYEGYTVTYAHAGAEDSYDASDVNDELVAGTQTLSEAVGTAEDFDVQTSVIEEFPRVFGIDGRTGRGPGAGLAWMDFEFMPEDAPPQVVGHTRHDEPTLRGNVVCQNIIRNNRRQPGGEGIVVETPDRLVSLCRDENGAVVERELSLPALETRRATGREAGQ